MVEIDAATLSAAQNRLAGPRLTIAEAVRVVPSAPGLYAVYGDPAVWHKLGLGRPADDRPLYVGKAERSLSSRDIKTHFSTGRSGSSTLRRSLAGLLADDLRLEGRPRNLSNPGMFANFGLAADGDERLTAWMLENLRLAVWPSTPGVVLKDLESAILSELLPPLNLDKVATPWQPRVRSGRKRLADEARGWRPPVAKGTPPPVDE